MKRAEFVRMPLDVWADQVDELLDAIGDIAYVAGGAARQVIMGTDAPEAWDVDLFLYDPVNVDLCKSRIASLGYTQDCYTEHSSQFDARADNEVPVQVIEFYEDEWSRTSGYPEDVLSCFSFTTEMFAIVRRGSVTEAIVGKTSIDDTLSRMLIVQNVTDPLVVSLRAVKHGYKGFGIAPDQMQKVFDAYLARAMVPA